MRTREEGRALVQRYQESKLKKIEFCRQDGISPNVLRYWLDRIDKIEAKNKVQFIELQTSSHQRSSASRLRIELPTGATLHFDGIPDQDLLLSLVSNNQAV
jgi:hypothetical protein